MKMDGLTFPEAAERLAERVGLPWHAGPQGPKGGRDRQDVLRANEAAMQFYQDQLQAPVGAAALAYLQERGVTPASLEAFRLGYAPAGWDNLLRHLAGKGFGEQLLEQASLLKRSDRGGHYDVFRNRIIFPIVDVSGRTVGFGGRAMDPEDPAKYLNSSDTPIFRKGSTVYGLNLARPAITERKLAMVVEGYMDVIALVEGGFPNVVACLGTATTEQHLHLLARYAEEIVFVYDADAAGMRAALRNAQLFESSSADAKIATLPEGQDPDDCVRGGGPHVLQECLDRAVSFVEYRIRAAFAEHDPNSADGRLRAAREAVDILGKVRDPARREEMLERTADWWARDDPPRAEALARVLRLELRRRLGEMRPEPRAATTSPRDRGFTMDAVAEDGTVRDPRVLEAEREVLRGAMSGLALCRYAAAHLAAEDFTDTTHRELANALFTSCHEDGFVPTDAIGLLEQQGGVGTLAVELRLSGSEVTEEEFAASVANFQKFRGAWGLRAAFTVDPESEVADEQLAAGEDFESLRRRVVVAIASGQLSYDDPDYIRYSRLSRRFRGKGQRGFVEHAGSTPLGATPVSDAPPSEQTGPADDVPAGDG
jgi:DNA primase catalytic core